MEANNYCSLHKKHRNKKVSQVDELLKTSKLMRKNFNSVEEKLLYLREKKIHSEIEMKVDKGVLRKVN